MALVLAIVHMGLLVVSVVAHYFGGGANWRQLLRPLVPMLRPIVEEVVVVRVQMAALANLTGGNGGSGLIRIWEFA